MTGGEGGGGAAEARGASWGRGPVGGCITEGDMQAKTRSRREAAATRGESSRAEERRHNSRCRGQCGRLIHHPDQGPVRGKAEQLITVPPGRRAPDTGRLSAAGPQQRGQVAAWQQVTRGSRKRSWRGRLGLTLHVCGNSGCDSGGGENRGGGDAQNNRVWFMWERVAPVAVMGTE